MSAIEQVPAEDWETWTDENDGLVLDVRNPDEWGAAILPGVEKISLPDLPTNLDRLDKDTPLLVMCRSGNRSQQAAKFLQAHGYQAANAAGGMKSLGLQD
ncbi:MAG: rhodanese-like domain-containing protein [Acidimicrobiia bacterium]|nr:rhodanese-like domain-containing protein [Acidimicrobiia bacterium]